LAAIIERIENDFLEPLTPKARAALHDALLLVAAKSDVRFQPR
jgi:hypothetical protein